MPLRNTIYGIWKAAVLAIGFSFLSTPAFSSSLKSEKSPDPETITLRPAQTQNGMGMNFPSLGSFEEDFLAECRALEMSEHRDLGEILFLGEVYGRLPMHVLRKTNISNLMSMVNDLSIENLKPLLKKIVSMKKSIDTSEIQQGFRHIVVSAGRQISSIF